MDGSSTINENSIVYRIFSLDRFHEMFTKNRLTLVHPRLWDDPFENFLFSATLSVEGVPVSTSQIQNELYGLCWTINQESDAMWRIYSPQHRCPGSLYRREAPEDDY